MPFSLSDILAGYGGSPDPENPSSGEITPGLLLRALGHVAAPGQVAAPVFDPNQIDPTRGSAFTPAMTARDYATALSAGKNKPPDPLETMLGVAGGEPATFIAPGRVPGGAAAVARFNKAVAGGMTEEEARQLTGVNLNAARQPQMEISDAGSTFRMPTPEEIKKGGTLGDFMSNWRPGELVPELNKMPVLFKDPTFEDRPQSLGFLDTMANPPIIGLNPATLNTPEKMRDAVLHEAGGHGASALFGYPAGGSPFDPSTIARAQKAVRIRKQEIEQTKQDVAQRAATWATDRAPDETQVKAYIQKYFEQNPGDAELMRGALIDEAKNRRGRLKMEKQFEIYQGGAGEEQARVIQKSKDKTQEELLRGPSPEARSDRPYSEQLVTPQKARSWLDELPSFSERMGQARDTAFAGRQRGTGNILPRETTYEPPLLAPGETRGDLVRALTPGMEPAERSIADIGRDVYRSTELPIPRERPIAEIGQRSYREQLGLPPPREPQFSIKPTTEMTDIGEQYVLPGAERLTPAQMAQRKAAESLKAKVPQQEPGGLFGPTEGEQGKMFKIDLPPEDVSGPSMGIGAPAVLRPDRPLFDLSPQGLARSHVQREQFDLPRTTAETVTPEYERATSKANIARVNREVAQGIKEHGLDWHAMGQLRDRYIAELGEKAGAAEFERYMREVGATSPNSNVEQNFRTASYYAQQRRAGEPLPQIAYKRSTGNPYLPPREAPPSPYGNTAQGLHVMNLGLLERGEPYPLSRPKVPSFTENMLGNYRPVAVDRHNLRMWGIDAEAPNLTGYKHLERTQQEQAGKMGIHPAQYQAAPWPFYAKSGADPALALFDKRLTHTAERLGKTKAQVLLDFIRGQAPLLSLGPAAVLLGQAQPAPEPVQ